VVRQARSEVTRQKIIDAAADLFTEQGYGATGLGDIIDRVGVTKGALYYHFDCKESLARAIVAGGAAAITKAFAGISVAPAPAFENMIHGVFVVADMVRSDKQARTALYLTRVLGESSDAASEAYDGWRQLLSEQAAQAQQQGDLRDGVAPAAAAELVLATILGVELLSRGASGGADLTERLASTWEVLLPALASPEALAFFKEYLARESMRHAGPALII